MEREPVAVRSKIASSHVDWAAVLGGAAIAVAIGILATGFGAALGLTAISAEEGEGSGTLATIISVVWIIGSMIGAYTIGGYVAGRMGGRIDRADVDEVKVRDGINGLVVWAVGVVLSAMVLTSAVSSTVSAVGEVAAVGADVAGTVAGGAMDAVGSAAAAAMPDDPMSFVSGSLLRPSTVDPTSATSESTTQDVTAILANVVTTGEISDADRAYLVQLTAARTGLSPAEVETRVAEAITAAQGAREDAANLAAEAEETARQAAETARIAAILTAFLLTAAALVAAAAAYIGAVKGGRDRDEGRVYGGLSYRG